MPKDSDRTAQRSAYRMETVTFPNPVSIQFSQAPSETENRPSDDKTHGPKCTGFSIFATIQISWDTR
jgi:hypothetical protein